MFNKNEIEAILAQLSEGHITDSECFEYLTGTCGLTLLQANEKIKEAM